MTRYYSSLFISMVFVFSFFITTANSAPSETITLSGLQAEVTVSYDENGIPTIDAENLHDLMFAQGYVHARDRLWQMDINRRRAGGSMAELFGKGSLGGDYNAHIATLPQVSQKVWDECLPIECETFQAYSDGVNAYIKNMKELPPEYKQLGVTPEEWTPVDSLVVGRGLIWGMSSSLQIEIALGVVAKMVGKTALMGILPLDGMDDIPIVNEEEIKELYSSFPEDEFNVAAIKMLDNPFFGEPGYFIGPSVGSNNWVVSGKLTESGFPMLSDDTHMGLQQPCDWYEVNLNAGDLHAVGLSVPGTPGMLVGHNEYVSWGVTQARLDVTDAYVEKLDPEKPDTHYLHKGESLPFEKEEILLKYRDENGEMQQDTRTILHTIHGPVVYEEDRPRNVISYRWTGHEPTHEGAAFFGVITAKNLEEFKAGLEHFEVGGLNMVYADVHGDIFFRGQAKVPLRKGTPYLPLDGSSGKYEWQKYIPYERLPQSTNPEKGYLVTANNRQVRDGYKYYIGAIYDKGYRARRISELIEEKAPITVEDMQAIQMDVYNKPADDILPVLFDAVDVNGDMLTEKAKAALEALKAWDRYDKKEYVEPAIFYTMLKHCVINIFKDNLPPEVFQHMGRSEVLYPLIVKNKKLPMDFFDDLGTPDVHETKQMMLVMSLNDAVADLEEKYGPEMSGWNWSKMHSVTLRHQLKGEFNVGPEVADGGSDSINVADFGFLSDNFDFGHGPNMRMTVEMDPAGVKGKNIIAGGQSGDPASPHYADQFLKWLNGETHDMPFDVQKEQAEAARTIVLKP